MCASCRKARNARLPGMSGGNSMAKNTQSNAAHSAITGLRFGAMPAGGRADQQAKITKLSVVPK